MLSIADPHSFCQGIIFLDLFPVLRDPIAFETLLTHLLHHITSETIPKSVSRKVDVVVGLDARGFLLGPPLALRLGAAFAPVRKQGKLPGKCVSAIYEKEYGNVRYALCNLITEADTNNQDVFEMQIDSIQKGQTVLIVDDLIATGM